MLTNLVMAVACARDEMRIGEEAVVLAAESVARCAALLADRSRAAMCLALLDGRAWTVGELAHHVGVSRSTASEHVSLLMDGRLLTEQRQGRHRYVRLADHEVAPRRGPGRPERRRRRTAIAARRPSLGGARGGEDVPRPLGRVALDWTERRPHLAGRAGAALHRQLLARSWTARAADHRAITVTPAGERALAALLGLDLPPPDGPSATARVRS